MARGDLRAKIRLEGDATGANKAIKSVDSAWVKAGRSIRSVAISVTATIATLTGAYKALEAAGKRLGQQRALETSLTAEGKSADAFVEQLQRISNQQISTADIILSSNRAIALGISSDDIPGLLEAATRASVSLGISATQAFNDIATGVGRASPLILDNLGIVVDSNAIYKEFAASVGTTTENLTKQQKTTALAAAVMKNAAKGAEDFATAQSRVSVALAQTVASFKDFINGAVESVAQSDKFASSLEGGIETIKNYAGAIRLLDEALKEDARQQALTQKATIDWTSTLDLLTLNINFANRAVLALGAGHRELEDVQAEAAANAAKLAARIEEQNRAMADSIGFLVTWGDAQENAAARTKRIEAGLAAETSALSKLAAALGEVTQLELEKELNDISDALESARNSTDASSDAFVRYEQIAGEKIDRLKLRIEGLKDGIGDIGEASVDAADGIGTLGDKADDTSDSIDDLGDSIDGASVSTLDLTAKTRAATEALKAEATQALLTTKQFDALSASAGRAAAVQEQVSRGGQLTQGGTRIQLPGGGSRLVNVSGTNSSSTSRYGLSPFGTGGRYTVSPNGTLNPY